MPIIAMMMLTENNFDINFSFDFKNKSQTMIEIIF